MVSSEMGTMVMLTNSDSSDFVCPTARFMVRCTLGPLKPSFLVTSFEMKLVLEPLHSFFFYKNLFYKNVEAEIDPNFKNVLRTFLRLRVD